MLTIKDFTTDREHLTDLLSVATYGNYWPVVRAYKSDAEKGLFTDCDCYEDKLAVAPLNGKGVVVYDQYEEEDDAITGDVWLQLAVFGEVIYG